MNGERSSAGASDPVSAAGPSGEAVVDAGWSDAGEASAAKACSKVGLASGVLPPEGAGAESATAVDPSMSSFPADTALLFRETRAQKKSADDQPLEKPEIVALSRRALV